MQDQQEPGNQGENGAAAYADELEHERQQGLDYPLGHMAMERAPMRVVGGRPSPASGPTVRRGRRNWGESGLARSLLSIRGEREAAGTSEQGVQQELDVGPSRSSSQLTADDGDDLS